VSRSTLTDEVILDPRVWSSDWSTWTASIYKHLNYLAGLSATQPRAQLTPGLTFSCTQLRRVSNTLPASQYHVPNNISTFPASERHVAHSTINNLLPYQYQISINW